MRSRPTKVAKDRGIALYGRDKRRRASLESIRDEVGYHAAWARWSATSDDGAVIDTEAVRYVRRFGREFRRLATRVE